MGGEGEIRNRSAIFECTSCRFLVARAAENAGVAGAAWPMLAHENLSWDGAGRFIGNRKLEDVWNPEGPLDGQSGLVRFNDLDDSRMIFAFAANDDGR